MEHQNFSWERKKPEEKPTHYAFEDEPELWGIKYPCPICRKQIKFPACPNADTDRHEALAHGIYTACRNENKGRGRFCWECEGKIKRGEIENPFADEDAEKEEQ